MYLKLRSPTSKIAMWLPVLIYFISPCFCFDKCSPELEQNIINNLLSNVILDFDLPDESLNQISPLLKEIAVKSHNPVTSRSKLVTDLVTELQNNVLKALDSIVQLLTKLAITFKVLWATFQVFIFEANGKLIQQLVELSIVKFIRLEIIFSRQIPPQTPGSRNPPTGNHPWNINLLDARCKNITCLGKGLIIGFSDTGARATHVEIRDNFLGKSNKLLGFLNGIQTKNSDSNYLCTATDPDGHGTHCIGSAVGKNVGVAPEALWMMCLDCGTDVCPESAMIICGQWLACPYHCNDTSYNTPTKDCSKRPHIISNSWKEDTKSVNVVPYDFYYKIVQLWNSMGIMSVFAGGNDGPYCTTIGFPGSYDISIAVGAVAENATLADFSSTGPALSSKLFSKESVSTGSCVLSECQDGEDICSVIKPDIVGPGVNINSSTNASDTSYDSWSGTSMATPQVAGVLALMRCANPYVAWNYKEGYKILTETADTSMIDLMCTRQNQGNERLKRTNDICNKMISGICGTYPNNMYGYGLVYACKAVIAAQNRKS